jgi:hypothetical protein
MEVRLSTHWRNENFLLQNSGIIRFYAIPPQGHFYTAIMVGSKLHFYSKRTFRAFFAEKVSLRFCFLENYTTFALAGCADGCAEKCCLLVPFTLLFIN